MFVKQKAIVFYFEYRARIVLPNITRLRPRGSDYEEITMRTRGNSRSPTRVRDTRKIFAVYFSRESGNGQFREPGGAVPRGGVCKIGEAPARGAARSAAGGRRRRPKAGDAFRGGGGTRPSPLDVKPARGNAALPPKAFPRNASCPPRGRGNERFLLSFNGRTRSAPGTMNILHETQNSAVLHVGFSGITCPTQRFVRLPTRARGTIKLNTPCSADLFVKIFCFDPQEF